MLQKRFIFAVAGNFRRITVKLISRRFNARTVESAAINVFAVVDEIYRCGFALTQIRAPVLRHIAAHHSIQLINVALHWR